MIDIEDLFDSVHNCNNPQKSTVHDDQLADVLPTEILSNTDSTTVVTSSDIGANDQLLQNLAEITPGNIISHSRHRIPVSYKRIHVQSTAYLYKLALSSTVSPPKTYQEIIRRLDKDDWIQAYRKEVQNIESIGQLEVVDRPIGEHIIPVLELFTVKYDNINSSTIPKCRIVARGDLQAKKDDMYSPVASAVAFRVFMIFSRCFDGKMKQLDVSGAFLYGRLKRPVYLELPQGHPRKTGTAKVWKSLSAVYGLCESPGVWYNTLHQCLLDFGCKNLCTESCLYFWKAQPTTTVSNAFNWDLLIVIYVDDVIFSGTNDAMSAFQSMIENKFKIRSTDSPKEFIGMEIDRTDSKSFVVNQKKHISKAVRAFSLSEAKPVQTPLDCNTLNLQGSTEMTDKKLYQKLIGILNYISQCTRPDVAFCVGYLARRVTHATIGDLKQAKRVLTYLRDTSTWGLEYPIQDIDPQGVKLEMYVDASFANGDERKSICGYVIRLESSILSYKSKQQPFVTLSSTESEYVSLAMALQELKWIKNLLDEANIKIKLKVVYSDNQACIRLAKNKSSMNKTRHLDIKLQFMKYLVISGEFDLQYVTSEENQADIFTKVMKKPLFTRLAQNLVKES